MSYLKHSKKEGKKFQNPVPTGMMKGGFWSLLWKYITVKAERVPRNPLGPFRTETSVYNALPSSGLRITLIGHSSLLIEIDGRRLLTDPVWAERVSPVSFAGPKRFFAAPLALHELPPLDAVILSHDHYDHLDKDVMKYFADKQVPLYCSLGVGAHLVKWGIDASRITAMDWTNTVTIADDIKVTAVPARHFSGRSMFNRNETLWSAFVITGPQHNIFFGADSGIFPGFKDIGDKYGPFDLAMLEIGAYGEGWPDIHMGPANAAGAFLMLNAKQMMPIHWGTFNLALHAWREPIEILLEHARDKSISLFVPEPGRPTEVTGEEHISGWWEKY